MKHARQAKNKTRQAKQAEQDNWDKPDTIKQKDKTRHFKYERLR